jgi:hypothetical protein
MCCTESPPFYRVHPPKRASSSCVYSQCVVHIVVGPCVKGQIIHAGSPDPKFFFFLLHRKGNRVHFQWVIALRVASVETCYNYRGAGGSMVWMEEMNNGFFVRGFLLDSWVEDEIHRCKSSRPPPPPWSCRRVGNAEPQHPSVLRTQVSPEPQQPRLPRIQLSSGSQLQP